MSEREIDRWICAAPAVIQTQKVLSQKVKLSIYWSIYIPIVTYGRKLWAVTERHCDRIQVAEFPPQGV